jgi:hypothetical protein
MKLKLFVSILLFAAFAEAQTTIQAESMALSSFSIDGSTIILNQPEGYATYKFTGTTNNYRMKIRVIGNDYRSHLDVVVAGVLRGSFDFPLNTTTTFATSSFQIRNGEIIRFNCKVRLCRIDYTVLEPVTTTTSYRDPLKQPFAVNSPWNMPIGTGARYVRIDMDATPGDDPWAPMPQIDTESIVLKPTAPVDNIYYSDVGWSDGDRCIPTLVDGVRKILASVPMPFDFIKPDSGKNEGAVFLMADRRTLVHVQPLARCTAGSYGTALARIPDVDLYGDGRMGAHGGSRLSNLGGTIRVGEFAPGKKIRHALKINVDSRVELANCESGECFRWPAYTADKASPTRYGSLGSAPPGMKMGALLAIPRGVDINALGLESEPGRIIAWTMQNYGAYIVDSTGGYAFGISAEAGPDGDVREEFQQHWIMPLPGRVKDNTKWTRDVQRIVRALYLVDNNGPTSIGGGGTPLQPLALPLKAP